MEVWDIEFQIKGTQILDFRDQIGEFRMLLHGDRSFSIDLSEPKVFKLKNQQKIILFLQQTFLAYLRLD